MMKEPSALCRSLVTWVTDIELLAAMPDKRLVSFDEISDKYGIAQNTENKTVQHLEEEKRTRTTTHCIFRRTYEGSQSRVVNISETGFSRLSMVS